MSVSFDQMVAALVAHLEDLKAHGHRYVAVSPQSLALLQEMAPVAPAGTRPLSRPPVRAVSPPPAGVAPARTAVANPAPALAPALDLALALDRDLNRRPESPTGSASPTPAPGLLPRPASQDRQLDAIHPPNPDPVAAMAELRSRALVCQKCPHLARSRKQVVFGVGSVHAELMFVGEAPGADEDEQGEPFVGKAGQLLTRIIQTMGFSRDTVYIANILKCRPDTPGQSAGNRKPTPQEMQTCLPYLLAQIDLIRPKVLVALGATAVEGLLGKTQGITRLRGHFQTFREIPLMPTYHPAYLLRNQSLATKREVWEDMLQVLERLGRPISEKQRGYFLKS